MKNSNAELAPVVSCVPSDLATQSWPMVRLGDVCEIRAGATHHGIESETGPYPVYGSGGYICQATEYRCPANTVTVGRKGTLDKPLLIEEPFWNIDTCFGVIPNESLDVRYLWRFCQNFDFYSLIPSIGRPSTNSDAIKLIQIPIPPLPVQREIVAWLEMELGEADALAAKFKEIAENADAEFKAELDETFKNVEGEKVRLGDVCQFQRGLTYKKSDEVAQSDNIVLRSNNIDLEKGTLDLSELKYIREDFFVPADKKVMPGSILMCMANGSKSHLGKVALVQDDLGYAFGGFME